jgi:hypothetical protein
MGLTRLKAEQISDIDYKQAVRVITVTDIANLSGGAPSQVDGVNLTAGDRILVTAQDPGSENGIYQVQTVGTGLDGTWVRSLDTNATGELEAGTIVMVTEGNVYADTQWKLTTNNPIVIGTTPLTFELNSAFAFGNIVANATAVIANTVGATVTFTAGTGIEISGDNASKIVTIAATGTAAVSEIANGTSNVAVVSSGGNVTVGVGGTSNIVVFATTGQFVTGLISATGNITGNYILGNGSQLTGIDATSIQNGTANVRTFLNGNVTTSASGTANVLNVTSTGTITTGTASVSGNVTAGNVSATNLTGTLATAAQTNITSVGTLGALSVTGNVQGGNLGTVGLISATGAITGAAITGTSLTVGTGNLRCGNIQNNNGNGVGNIGNATAYFNTVFAKATSAQYADLAEMYVADKHYQPGTLVEFGGTNEVTITTQSHSTRIAGIVSTNPSYLMNATQTGNTVVPVALTGRVPCSVIGIIEKGDRLVASDIAGVAQRLDPDKFQPACIVGKALENYISDQPGIIEVAVGRT